MIGVYIAAIVIGACTVAYFLYLFRKDIRHHNYQRRLIDDIKTGRHEW